MSKSTDNWTTPKWLMIQRGWWSYFDPCPLNAEFDGLKIPWEDYTFVNPPYSETKKWVDKAIKELELKNCKLIEMLLPVDTSTKWFHKLYPRFKVEFLQGRLKFNDQKNPARFASMIVYLNETKKN